MEPYRDDHDLTAELREMRPTPSPAFAAELDARAAAGFPPRSSPGESPLGRLGRRLRTVPPRRGALAAAATALAAVALATVIVAVGEPQHSNHAKGTLAATGPAQPSLGVKAHGHTGVLHHQGGSGDSAGTQFLNPLPSTTGVESASGSAALSRTGPYAYEAGHRDVQRTAGIVLGTEPSQVPDDAAKVFEAVHASNGIVLTSSVRGGASGRAGAVFDLLIPSAKLDDALAALSEIGEVRSRQDAGRDITSPTVRLGERLRDSRATVEGLLVQLARADTDAERAEVELKLRAQRRRAASLRGQVIRLNRRANLSRVSVRIETGAGASSTSHGSWGIDDALGDAGHILAIAAGVTLIGLAVLGPIALIALLAWLAHRAWVRQRRERALG